MAKRLERITALGRIDYSGAVYLPGETFECDAKEAKRLVEDGVAAVPMVPAAPAAPQQKTSAEIAEEARQAELAAQQELLANIAAATTREELEALIPAEEPEDADFAAALTAAAEARLAELDEPHH